MKNIFLVLLMSLMGAGLTGCGLFGDGGGEGESVEDLKSEVAELVEEAKEKAQAKIAEQKAGIDYADCEKAKTDADSAKAKADGAAESAQALEAKTEAQAALEAAEGCGEKPTGQAQANPCQRESGSVKCTHNTELYTLADLQVGLETKRCDQSNLGYDAAKCLVGKPKVTGQAAFNFAVSGDCSAVFDTFLISGGAYCRSRGDEKCKTARDEWVAKQTADGSTCS